LAPIDVAWCRSALVLQLFVCLALVSAPPPLSAECRVLRSPDAAAGRGGISGIVSTLNREVLLPGVEVLLLDDATGQVQRTTFSDGAGQYRLDAVPAGRYRVKARLQGFGDRESPPTTLDSNQQVQVNLVLEVVAAESVTVRGQAGEAAAAATAATASVEGRMVDVLPVASDGYRSLLPVLPGVVRQADGRISVKGARPTQGALSVSGGSGVDPSTGTFGVELPSDAVESVEVRPNPYTAEDGRFSAGLVRVETRAGSNTWRASANTFIPAPCLTLCDGYSMGIRNYNPRGWFGGPLARDKVFLSQAVEYRLAHARISSLPDPDNQQRSDSVDAFTRIDVHPAAGHALTLSAALFPRRLLNAGMNTFNPQEVSPDLRSTGYQGAVVESATLAPTALLTSRFSVSLFDVSVTPHNDMTMGLTVDGNQGGFFNQQHRRTTVLEWAETLTLSKRSRVGEHLFKVGLNTLYASYDGESESRPVVVSRADGTVSWRQEFGPATRQDVGGADVAAFAQDQWRITSPILLEAGLRVDRDGVLLKTSVGPRLGFAATLVPSGAAMLRGGAGLFYERTPLNVSAFESLEAATVTRFAANGAPIGPPVFWRHRSGRLDTPRATVWNIEVDVRPAAGVLVKANYLRRNSSSEFIVDPVSAGDSAELRLASTGRSAFQEAELSVRFGESDGRQVTCSYVRSHTTGDTNAYDMYFGTLRTPVIEANEYSLAPVDVPNRFLVRSVWPLTRAWSVTTLLEVRDGFPYSLIDENQAFVGPRNTGGRFPPFGSLDASILRTATWRGRGVRFGVRVNHVLNGFMPRDVQNNVDSAAFGTFYNGLIRRIMFTLQLTSR
jgi:hypothetical protein